MNQLKRRESVERFETRLNELRLKIDALPEQQRPHLYELADLIAEQHRRAIGYRGLGAPSPAGQQEPSPSL